MLRGGSKGMNENLLSKRLVEVFILIFLDLVVQPCIEIVLSIGKIYKQIVYTCYTVTCYFIWIDRYGMVK